MRTAINQGTSYYQDIHLSHMGPSRGLPGRLHVAVVEVTAITEEGWLIPSSSVGMNRTYLENADKIILEVNSLAVRGPVRHARHLRPHRRAAAPPRSLPILNPGDRIGDTVFKIDTDKIVAIVETK